MQIQQKIISVKKGVSMNEGISKEMIEIKTIIAQTVAKREALKKEMEEHSKQFPQKKFQRFQELIVIDSVLSELDTTYKKLWDFNNIKSNMAS